MCAFRWVSPDCSWYEHHMLDGCQRPEMSAEHCLRPAPSLAAALGQRSARIHSNPPRLLVVVPYRGDLASPSLEQLCSRLPVHLDRHNFKFVLLLVNQTDQHPFNRGMLVNVAFTAMKQGLIRTLGKKNRSDWFTYMAIQDVDRFPVQSNHSCEIFTSTYYSDPGLIPRVLHPMSYTGGVLLVRTSVFHSLNGFSNMFWGWGHEDNELYLRFRQCGLRPSRAPEIESCMQHIDCTECRNAKGDASMRSLREETRLIAIVQQRIRDKRLHIDEDGLSNVEFDVTSSSRQKKCGRHSMHILDVALLTESVIAWQFVLSYGSLHRCQMFPDSKLCGELFSYAVQIMVVAKK
ncbi:MAG: hypothetical protein SGPRY_003274 [Prymnesium sp.]